MKGEGFVRGAIIVLGSREQGILHVHYEEFGEKIEFTQIEEAIKKIEGARQPQARL